MAFIILAFSGYFAFTTFLYSPLEDDYEFSLATLIPRDVDFFLSKSDLADDFGEFPVLAAVGTLEKTRAGRTFFESPMWGQFRADYDIEGQITKLEEALNQAPISVEPLKIFGGSNVVIAGYFRGSDLFQTDMVALGRTNWMGKMGQSVLSYPGLIGLEDQGFQVEDVGGVVSISGGTLSRTLHVGRILDVLVVGTSHELVAGAKALDQNKGQDSFGQSSRYADYILNQPNREPQDIEIFVDHDAVIKNSVMLAGEQWTGQIPEMDSESFTSAFLGHLGQVSLIKEFEGVIGFSGGLAANIHADLSSEKLNSQQKRFYRQKGFNRGVIDSVAKMTPERAGLLAYMQADVADILRMVLESTEPALQANFHNLVRSVWAYQDGTALFDDLDVGLKNRLALVVCENNYPPELDKEGNDVGPPHDNTPTVAWAVIGWVKDESVLVDFHEKIVNNQGRFLIQGRESGDPGVFTKDSDGGLVIFEYWSQFVPGTGHMAALISDDVFIIGNHTSIVQDILLTKFSNPSYPKLSNVPKFTSLVGLGLNNASAFAYIDPQQVSASLRAMAYDAASNAVDIPWSLERPRIQNLVLKNDFEGKREEDLNPQERGSYDRLLQNAVDDFETAFLSEHIGQLNDGFERVITYLEAMSAGLVELALDPKRIDLSLRTILPMTAE
ncbi:MAG: hypothetical protein ACI84E_002498 [Planctomycetota bacterium]|jgi:hypothetical protein